MADPHEEDSKPIKVLWKILTHLILRKFEVSRIAGGRVTSSDISRNTDGEDMMLKLIWRFIVKAWGATTIRYCFSPCSQRCLPSSFGAQAKAWEGYLKITLARVKLKEIGVNLNQLWNMLFNSILREKPYQFLHQCECFWEILNFPIDRCCMAVVSSLMWIVWLTSLTSETHILQKNEESLLRKEMQNGWRQVIMTFMDWAANVLQ